MTRKRAEKKSKKSFKKYKPKLLAVIIILLTIVVLGAAVTFLPVKDQKEETESDGKWLFALDTNTVRVGNYEEYRTGYIPTLVVVDVNGDIIHKEAGVHTESQLLDLIEEAQNPTHTLGPAPDFTLKTFNGETFTLSEHHGKVVILDFMAVRCPPCHQQMPELHKVKLDKGDDVIILSIDVDAAYGSETEQDVREAFGEYIEE